MTVDQGAGVDQIMHLDEDNGSVQSPRRRRIHCAWRKRGEEDRHTTSV